MGKGGSPQASLQRVLKKVPLVDRSPAQCEAVFQEAQLMRRISRECPFIVQFNEVFLGKAGTILCLVMEFCSGGDLRHTLKDRNDQRLPEPQVLAWIAQIGLALYHCHAHEIVHRDVKPENCFLRSPNGDLLLGDFGISCSLDERSFAKTCVGSPLYMSPEVMNQEKYSYATDVWSLGVVLYETAMLAPPFKGTNICQLAFKIVMGEPDPMDEQCSDSMRQLSARLLVKNPAERPRLADLLVQSPLEPMAAAANARYNLAWPPTEVPLGSSSSRSGVVQKLRGNVAGAVAGVGVDDDLDVDAYADDFEEASASDASYEADFETFSDAESDDVAAIACQTPVQEFSETKIRQKLREELGEEALAAFEKFASVPFLGTVGIAAR